MNLSIYYLSEYSGIGLNKIYHLDTHYAYDNPFLSVYTCFLSFLFPLTIQMYVLQKTNQSDSHYAFATLLKIILFVRPF